MVPQPNGKDPEEKHIGAHEVMKHGPDVVSEEWKDRMARSSNPHRNADAWKMLGAQQTTSVQQWAKDDDKRAAAAAQQLADDTMRIVALKQERRREGYLEDDKQVWVILLCYGCISSWLTTCIFQAELEKLVEKCGGSLWKRAVCATKNALGIKDAAGSKIDSEQFKKDHAKFNDLKEQRAKGVELKGADKVCTIS
jgi:hypothetical protein